MKAAWDELEKSRRRLRQRDDDIDSTIDSLQKQAANLAKAIAAGGKLEALVVELEKVEAAIRDAQARRDAAAEQETKQQCFATQQDVEDHLEDAIHNLTATSFDFADLLRRAFPRFVIQPVQQLGSGQVRPRGQLIFCPDALLNTKCDTEQTGERIVMDLFDPPQFLRDVPEVRRMLQEELDLGPTKIGKRLGCGRQRAKRALDYVRQMQSEGLDELYRELNAKPKSASRWKPRRFK